MVNIIRKLLFPVSIGIVLTVMILFALFLFTSFSYTSEHLILWIENRQNTKQKRTLYNNFDLEDFPKNYTLTTPILEEWIIIYSNSKDSSHINTFKNQHLESRHNQILILLQEDHPIFNFDISTIDYSELTELKGINDLDESLEFLAKVAEVEYGESDLWKNSEWVSAKEAWETKRTQLIILDTYLLFLDTKQNFEPVFYEELDQLMTHTNDRDWFVNFENHLDKWW